MIWILVLLAAAGTARAPSAPPPLTVSAAISLTDALQDAAAAYRQAGGGEVRFNFAGSNVLARQIVSGAPVDVFISADAAQMDVVETAGRVAAGTRRDLLTNRLAVIAADGVLVQRIEDLAGPAVRRIALGDPAAVPAGVYARRYLEAIGLWSKVEGRVVPLGNVRAALTAVESGSAEAGIVYVTDVGAASRARLAFVVSDQRAPAIVYPAAVTTQAADREAAVAFLDFLKSATATRIFREHQFEPAPGR